MRLVTVKMPEVYLEGIDELVKLGRYSSRSEVIRTAIRDLLKRELWMSESELSYDIGSIPVSQGRVGVKRIRLI